MNNEIYEKRKDFESEIDKLTNYKPNSWQRIVREEDVRFKVICVGRRGGKSLYVVKDSRDGLVSDLVTPYQHVWIVAPNYDLTQRVWNELYSLAVTSFKSAISRINNTKGNYKIETIVGGTIEAKSAEDPEKLVGVGLTKIIIDEAAMVPLKAWNQSLRPTLIDHHGKAIFISTPKSKNWFWEIWSKGQLKEEVEWQSWRFTSYDNEYIDKKEIESATKDMPEYEYRQEILAQFEETAEQIFRNVLKQAIGKEKPPERGHRYEIGIDLGRKTSYTVITVVDVMTYPYEVVKIDRFKTLDWNLQIERIKSIWNEYPCLRLRVDATGIGDPVIQDLENRGVRIDPYIIKETSKRQYIDKLSIYINDGRLIYPKNQDLINELDTYGREISKQSGRVIYKPLGKFKEDCVSSLALAVWGLPDKPRKIKLDEDDKKPFKPINKITGY